MKKLKNLLGNSECLVFQEIKRALENAQIHVIPQQPLQSVIDVSALTLTQKERKTAKHATFDFLITDEKTSPLFVIEFDGPCHYEYPKTHDADLRKISICEKASLPILKIDYKLYDKFEKSNIVEFIVFRYIKWITEKEIFQNDLKEKINRLQSQEKTIEEIIDDLCVCEPEIEFNFKYYFPGIYKIEKDLYEKYKLYPEILENIYQNPFQSKYKVIHFASPEIHEGVVAAYSSLKVIGKLYDQGIIINYEKEFVGDKIEIRWLYEVADEENTKINPLNIQNAKYYRQLSNGIPGTQIYDLCTMLAEYSCLQKMFLEIERQGKKFINPTDQDLCRYYSINNT